MDGNLTTVIVTICGVITLLINQIYSSQRAAKERKKIDDKVQQELSPDDGNSMKDKINKTATHAYKAVQQNESIIEWQTQHQCADDDQFAKQNVILGKIAAEQMDMEKRMARFMIHEANNTLARSALVEEEKRLLIQIEREENLNKEKQNIK